MKIMKRKYKSVSRMIKAVTDFGKPANIVFNNIDKIKSGDVFTITHSNKKLEATII